MRFENGPMQMQGKIYWSSLRWMQGSYILFWKWIYFNVLIICIWCWFQFGYANISLGCEACNCNQNGSTQNYCDTHTGQCACKMGVEGLRCDNCQDEYYNLTSDGCAGKCFCLIFTDFAVTAKPLVSNQFKSIPAGYFPWNIINILFSELYLQ